MGKPNMQLLDFLSKDLSIRTFVETGTCYAETTLKAVKIFQSVHTIELSKEFFDRARVVLKGLASCYYGDTTEVLPKILSKLQGPIVYWLDAHYSGGVSAGVNRQCPLLTELSVINTRPGNEDYILIDDAHLFFSPAAFKIDPHSESAKYPFNAAHYPTLEEVFNVLREKPRYTVVVASWQTLESGATVMPEDIILSVPLDAKAKLFDWLLNFDLAGLPQ